MEVEGGVAFSNFPYFFSELLKLLSNSTYQERYHPTQHGKKTICPLASWKLSGKLCAFSFPLTVFAPVGMLFTEFTCAGGQGLMVPVTFRLNKPQLV